MPRRKQLVAAIPASAQPVAHHVALVRQRACEWLEPLGFMTRPDLPMVSALLEGADRAMTLVAWFDGRRLVIEARVAARRARLFYADVTAGDDSRDCRALIVVLLHRTLLVRPQDLVAFDARQRDLDRDLERRFVARPAAEVVR